MASGTSRHWLLGSAFLYGVVAPVALQSAEVDYNRQIRPILSDKCFRCHGPDEATRESGLRLDRRESAVHAADSGEPAIIPGDADASRLIARINSSDPAEVMPPPEINKPLSEQEKELLQSWIEAGAPYEQHWSFVPVQRPTVPHVRQTDRVRNDIDRFILARLEADGKSLSPEAPREMLIRRVTLDLTGLPPTLAEVDAFLADEDPLAYEKAVDRLLASPQYGERMAVDWLDAARYADTHGYHIDSGRDMTPWRDWVISAFNQNMPFDQFTVEQLAGDLLPGATIDQKIASGFNRNHMINFEGGAIPEEYHTAYVIDRVNTLGTVWLGLTVGCAQCHDHKYDPISQRDYYGLYAFFYNVPENGLDGVSGNAAPLLRLPTPEQSAEIARLKKEVASYEEQLNADRPDLDAAQLAWEQTFAPADSITWIAATGTDATGAPNGSVASQAEVTVQEDQSWLITGEQPVFDAYTVRFSLNPGDSLAALKLEAIADDRLPGRGPGRFDNGNFVLSDVRIISAPAGASESELSPARIRAGSADYSQPDYPVQHAFDDDPRTGWAIYPGIGQSHQAFFELDEPITCRNAAREVQVTLDFHSRWGRHGLGRFKLCYTTSRAHRSPESLPRPLRKIIAQQPDQRSDADRAQLRTYFRTAECQELKPLADDLKARQEGLKKAEGAVSTVMVMAEMPQPRATFLLVRGQYDKKGEPVTASLPDALPPLPEGAPANRLGLAQWLVSPDHPLTSRVIANRLWQMFLGQGLVKTAEDFGSQGELPTHPDLLDWLAAELMSGSDAASSQTSWDIKRMVRLIVTSSTYRQTSAVPRDDYLSDPENLWLARSPRFRLQAEFLRDQALFHSELLDPRIGGASVSPYQPAGLWEELMSREDGDRFTAQKYEQSHGADLYRRTMYTFWKRTCPPPTLATFDAPDRETCTVRRARTNTPLQALVLMNDPTYVEASRKLAERILGPEGGKGTRERLTFLFRLATSRFPTDEELSILNGLLEDQLAKYRVDPAAAELLLQVGESSQAKNVDAMELAAWTMLASAVLNLDEVVTRN